MTNNYKLVNGFENATKATVESLLVTFDENEYPDDLRNEMVKTLMNYLDSVFYLLEGSKCTEECDG